MFRYIVWRIIWMVIILVAFLSLLFVSIRVIQQYALLRYTVVDYEFKDVTLPIVHQYFSWLKDIFLEWNWGVSTSVHMDVPVFDVFLPRLPVTIKVNFLAFVVYTPIGILLGSISALKKNKFTDNAISIVTIIFMSIPGFISMLLLIMLFGYYLGWLPSQFPPADSVGKVRYTGFILPVVALSVGPIAHLTRLIRGELTEALTSEYLILARTKGLTKRQAVIRHAMRNAMVPIVPAIMLYIVGVLSGSVIIERIYSIPGTGRLFMRALTINNFDYNLIIALSAFYTAISLFSLLIVDITYGVVDPRIRIGSKK